MTCPLRLSPLSIICMSTTRHCNTLQHTATLCNTLQHTATHCNTLQYTAIHCNTLQHTAIHCNTLHHTAPHCNTLQHTATHYNTLQHTPSPLTSVLHISFVKVKERRKMNCEFVTVRGRFKSLHSGQLNDSLSLSQSDHSCHS